MQSSRPIPTGTVARIVSAAVAAGVSILEVLGGVAVAALLLDGVLAPPWPPSSAALSPNGVVGTSTSIVKCLSSLMLSADKDIVPLPAHKKFLNLKGGPQLFAYRQSSLYCADKFAPDKGKGAHLTAHS